MLTTPNKFNMFAWNRCFQADFLHEHINSQDFRVHKNRALVKMLAIGKRDSIYDRIPKANLIALSFKYTRRDSNP